jgi:hypothetical protein
MVMIEREQHEYDEWREAHPEAALNEAISVAIGCILTHEPDEQRRKVAIDTLILAHRAAQAEFAAVAAGHAPRRLH